MSVAEEIAVSIRGGKFRTVVTKAGRGAPLVYLHGALGPIAWSPVLGELAKRFTVYAPAHPGFGSGEGIEELDEVLDLAIYYHDFLDELGIERPHVIGNGLGGMIAAEAAALAPGRFGRLVLICPNGLWIDEVPTPDLFTFTPPQLVRSALHDPNGEVGRSLLAQFDSPERLLESSRSLASAGKFLWPLPDKGLKKRLHRLRMPTLIVWGASDGLIPTEYAHAFHRGIPGSRLAILNGAGHLPMLEQPEAFLTVVRRFLDDG